MIKRVLILSLALLGFLAAPAAAQTSDGYQTPSGAAVAGDDSIRVTGEGCPPNAAISYSYTGPESGSGTATADASGDYDFTIEGLAPGSYRVTVECGGETFVLNATVTAAGGTTATTAPRAAAGAGALPRTGDDSTSTLAQFGAAAVALGAVAVYGAKRRKAKAFA